MPFDVIVADPSKNLALFGREKTTGAKEVGIAGRVTTASGTPDGRDLVAELF